MAIIKDLIDIGARLAKLEQQVWLHENELQRLQYRLFDLEKDKQELTKRIEKLEAIKPIKKGFFKGL